MSLPVPVNSSGCGCCCSALFCAPLLNVLFAGAYSPHFKATRRPLERALEPFALTAQHSSRSLFLWRLVHTQLPHFIYRQSRAYPTSLEKQLTRLGRRLLLLAMVLPVCLAVQLAALHTRQTRRMRQTFCCLWSGTVEKGIASREGGEEREAQTAVLCVYTGRSVRIEIGTRRGVGYRRRRNRSSGGSLLAPWVSASFNVSIIWEAFYVAILR